MSQSDEPNGNSEAPVASLSGGVPIDSQGLFALFKGQISKLFSLSERTVFNEGQMGLIKEFLKEAPGYMKNLSLLKAKVINEFLEKDYLLLFSLFRVKNSAFIMDFSEIVYGLCIDPAFLGKLNAMEATSSLISTVIEIINCLLEVIIEIEKTELSSKLLFILDWVITSGTKLLAQADQLALTKVNKYLKQNRFSFDYIARHQVEREEAMGIASTYSSFYNLLVNDQAKYIGLFAKVFEEKQSNEMVFYVLFTVFFSLWRHLKKDFFESKSIKAADFSQVVVSVNPLGCF